jgi:hypothetical protein
MTIDTDKVALTPAAANDFEITRQLGGAASTTHQRWRTTWAEFAAWFAPAEVPTTDRPKHKLDGFIPGTFNGARKAAQMIEVVIGIADLDSCTLDEFGAITAQLSDQGIAYAAHTTYSHLMTCSDPEHKKECPGVLGGCHAPPQPKYRLAVPLSRPVRPEEWRSWDTAWRTFLEALAGRAGVVDRSTKDMSRFFYEPGRPEAGPDGMSGVAAGEPLDVDELIKAYASRALVQTTSTTAGPVSREDLRRLADKLLSGQNVQPERQHGGQVLDRILTTTDWALKGERDTSLFDLAIVLAETWPYVPAASVIEPIRAELVRQSDGETWDGGDAATSLEAKLARKQDERRSSICVVDPVRLQQLGRTTSYDPAEVAEWARAMSEGGRKGWLIDTEQSILALRRQLIVKVTKSCCYVFVAGTYLGPVDDKSEYLAHALEPAQVAPLSVQLREITSKGIRERKPGDLIRDYGVVALGQEDSLVAGASYYDHTRRVFVHASAPRRVDLDARNSIEIDGWLRRAFVGDDLQRVQDKLARVPDRSIPDPMLIFIGEQGRGKNLIVSGAASLFNRAGRPVDYGQIADSQFNSELAHTPVVSADETTASRRGTTNSFTFRQLVGQAGGLTTEAKFQQRRHLIGCVTYFGATNREDFLSLGEEGDLTSASIEALAARIEVVHFAPNAPNLRNSPADVAMCQQWIASGDFARHILWLAEHHTRANLPSNGGDYIRSIRERSGVLGRAIQHWIYEIMSCTALAGTEQPSPCVRVIDGRVYVSADLTARSWDKHGAFRHPITHVAVSRALDGITLGQRRLSMPRCGAESRRVYHQLDAEMLEEHADGMGYLPENFVRCLDRLTALSSEWSAPAPSNVTNLASRRPSQPPLTAAANSQARS